MFCTVNDIYNSICYIVNYWCGSLIELYHNVNYRNDHRS